jgi:DUF4097 and DUF4098 domain-containing protein YvlB
MPSLGVGWEIAMKRVLPLFALLLAFSAIASAEEWNKTYNLTGKPDLRVQTSDADIRVETWNQNQIEARVITTGYKIGDGGVQIIEHQSGNSVEMEVKLPRHFFSVSIGTRSHRVEVAIRMPAQGEVNLATGDGSIRLQGLRGEMDLKSGDGAEEIEDVDGRLRAQTSDGHIRARGRFDELDLSTGDGRVEATVLPGSTLAQGWNVRTGDGSVHLQLPSDLSAEVDLHTGDGHISLEVPITVSGQMAGNHIHGKLNQGGNLFTIHTGDGSIEVGKSSGTA